MFKVNNKENRTTSLTSFGVFILNFTFHTFFGVSIVDFEQVIVCWISIILK